MSISRWAKKLKTGFHSLKLVLLQAAGLPFSGLKLLRNGGKVTLLHGDSCSIAW